MKQDIIKEFNLPSFIKGKSFADASKAIERKFKDRTDKVSNETKQELLERLASAQEYLKSKSSKSSIEQNQNTLMFGGNAEGNEEVKGPGADAYLGAASGALELGQQAFGDTGIDTSGATEAPDVNVGGSTAKGAMKGAQAGMAFGPWGAVIGGVVGGAAGFIGGKKAEKEAYKAEKNFDLKQANDYRPNDYAFGGNMYANGGSDRPKVSSVNELEEMGIQGFDRLQAKSVGLKSEGIINNPRGLPDTSVGLKSKGIVGQDSLENLNKGIVKSDYINSYLNKNTKTKRQGINLNKVGKFAKENYAEALRYAPILGNLTNKLEKAETDRGSRLDSTYKPQLFDEQRLTNQLNQNNINKGLTESSGGDQGALRTNLLAAHLNKNKAKSDAYFKGSEINRSEQKFKFQTDRDKDKTNIMLDRDYNNRKAQDEGAFESAKQAKRSSLFEDLGDIGSKEQTYKKMVKEMFGYKWNGKYFVDKEGKEVEQSTIDSKIKKTKNG